LGRHWICIASAAVRAEHSKNKEARELHYPGGELAQIVERRWKARVIEKSDGSAAIAEFVFHDVRGEKPAQQSENQAYFFTICAEARFVIWTETASVSPWA
jgi:hypothetical protein